MAMAITRFIAEMRGVSRITDRSTWWRYLTAVLREFPRIVLNHSLRTADARMAGRRYVFAVGPGAKVSLEGVSFGLAREIYGRRIYNGMVGFEIHKNDVVVDLGANAGAFAAMAGVLGARVIAVEAHLGFIPILRENLKRNCIERCEIEWGLIGGRTGTFRDQKARESSTHWVEEPPMITVEYLMETYGLDTIDFLKIDIEGSEFDLLCGSPLWLSCVRRIAMEVHQEFGSCREITELLRRSGFAVTITDNEQNQVAELHGDYGFIFAKRLSDDEGRQNVR